MSTPTPGPRCPRCRRPLAAWRLNHCIYCGETLPAELKEGFEAPDALKWVERPPLSPDVSRKLEMMKVVPIGAPKKSRSLMTLAGALAVPIFGALFYLLYTIVRRLSPGTAFLVLAGGAGFLAYLGWVFYRASKK